MPEIADAEVEMPDMPEVPEIAVAEVPEIAVAEVPEIAVAEVEMPDMAVAEVEMPDMAVDVPDMPEVPEIAVPEMSDGGDLPTPPWMQDVPPMPAPALADSAQGGAFASQLEPANEAHPTIADEVPMTEPEAEPAVEPAAPVAVVEAIPSSAIPSGTDVDPHHFDAIAGILPPVSQLRAKPALIAAATFLEPGERVQAIVAGQYLAHDGIALVTDSRVLFANGRTFSPEVHAVSLSEVTDVKGWAESSRATLRVTAGQAMMVIGDIAEVNLAQSFAVAVRSRI